MNKKRQSIDDCKLIKFSKIYNRAGNLTSVHGDLDVPFEIERVFYIYDIPSGKYRGGHSHIALHQVLVSISGSFEVKLFDGEQSKKITLNRPNYGLHIVPGIWASEENFSSGSICLTLCSHNYSESDYIRKYDKYLEYIKNI